ncbi:MAG: hypothetical protein QM478_05375 [Flavobacteriaceae bacterium]
MLVKKIIFLISFGLVSVLSFSQENKDEQIQNLYGSTFNQNHTTSNPSTSNFANNVFITQIGDANYTNATVKSTNSSMTIIQNGNSNYSASHLNTKNLNATIIQFGSGNYYYDYALNTNETIDLELTQQGENLNFERFGVNSTTKNLKVKMKGTDRTIIVRSFN